MISLTLKFYISINILYIDLNKKIREGIKLISLKLHYEPPFSMLTKKLNELIKFDRALKLVELIEYLQEIYGEKFQELVWDKKKKDKLHKMLSIIINGRSYRFEGYLQQILKDGDDISFIYIFFGG